MLCRRTPMALFKIHEAGIKENFDTLDENKKKSNGKEKKKKQKTNKQSKLS